MKFFICILILLLSVNAYSRPAVIPSNFSEPPFSASQALKLVEKTLPKNDFILVAFEWSPLTLLNKSNPEESFYKQPITDHPLRLGLAGKPDAWSWFFTYATRKSGEIAKYYKWEFLSFQVQLDGTVTPIGSDN